MGAGMVGSEESIDGLKRRLESLELRMGCGTEADSSENCLFVGNLDNSRDALDLRASVLRHFAQLGAVSSVRINRDPSNRPYALVYFEHAGQVDAILKKGKITVLDGRHLRVEKSRTNCSLFIDSIPAGLHAVQVRSILAQYGSIREFNMLGTAYSQLPHSIAYVTYSSRTAAIFALSQIKQTTEWKADLKIEVKPTLTTAYDHRSIYIGKLNPDCISPKLLVERFRKYGAIDHLLLLVHPTQTLACAYVKYGTPSACYAAVRAENGAIWQGSALRVEMKRIDA
ncbi:hypothetical protein DSO57_1034017 [Entomophthora muscae]|uniref:Uncharacterized protein n=1 Tax=Entomophthora muscae TaxID=34485 RepID=A0ACC2TN06_9FUNG|nr:hypothetical protein DSO57_1034017 [Entomophthora muscae]